MSRRRPRLESLERRLMLAAGIDPSFNLIPAEVSTVANTPLAFTAYRGNQIEMRTLSGGPTNVQISLLVTRGTISLVGVQLPNNIDFVEGDGQQDTFLRLSGTPTALNLALEWVVFQPDENYFGSEAAITVSTHDLDVPVDGSLIDEDTVVIDVLPVDDFDASPTWPTIPGQLDESFGDHGIQVIDGSGSIDFISQTQMLEDGRLLAAGAFNNHIGVYRFLPDLTPDYQFGLGGVVEQNVGDGLHASVMIVDRHERIVIGTKDLILRFTPNGDLDSTFGIAGKIVDPFDSGSGFAERLVNDVKIRADGSIVVTGSFLEGQSDQFQIACFDENGQFLWRKQHDVFTNDIDSASLFHSRDAATNLILSDNGTVTVIGKGGDNYEFMESRQLTILQVDSVGEHISEVSVPTAAHLPTDVLALPDGKFLVLGVDVVPNSYQDPLFISDFTISRHFAGGHLDTEFGDDGVVRIPVREREDWNRSAALQNDGKLLIVGQSYTSDQGWEVSVVRLNHDGSLDSSFDADGKQSLAISTEHDIGYAVEVFPDGKILLAGRSADDAVLAILNGDRIQNDGENQAPINIVTQTLSTQINTPIALTEYLGNRISTTDTDIGLGIMEVTLSAYSGTVSVVNLNPSETISYVTGDGRDDVELKIRGRIDEINAALQWIVFTPDVDYTGTEATLTVSTSDLGSSGSGGSKQDTDVIQITVNSAYAFEQPPSWEVTPSILDEEFGVAGIKTHSLSSGADVINQMMMMENGKIMAVGGLNDHFGIMRFNADLTFDTTFGANGFTETDLGPGRHAWDIQRHPNGGWLVSGSHALARYTESGLLDASFGTEGVISIPQLDKGTSISISAHGVIAVTGHHAGNFSLLQYSLDGQLLSLREQVVGRRSVGVFPKANGDILIAGGAETHQVARINLRGSLLGVSELSSNETLANRSLELPDGTILLVGQRNGHMVVSRFLPDGTPDFEFGTSGITEIQGLASSETALNVSLQNDGKILIVGRTLDEQSDVVIARLHYDGTVDSSFDGDGILQIPVSDADNAGKAVLMLPDGRILIGGRSNDEIMLVALLGSTNILARMNNPPTLDHLPDLIVDNTPSFHEVSLQGLSAGGELQDVRIIASSSNVNLIPDPEVVYANPQTSGTLLFEVISDQSATTTITVTVEDNGPDGDFSSADDNRTFTRSFDVVVTPINQLPAMDELQNLTVPIDSTGLELLLTGITDGDDELQPIRISAASSNHLLVSDPEVVYEIGETTGTLSFSPNQLGTARITITMEDGGFDRNLETTSDNSIANYSFELSVVIANSPPTLDSISNAVIMEDSSSYIIELTGISAGIAENQPLRITAVTNAPEMLGEPVIDYVEDASIGTLILTPIANQSGIAALNVILEDGGPDNDLNTPLDNATTTRAFGVEVVPVNDAPFFNSLPDIKLTEGASSQVIDVMGIHAGGSENQDLKLTAVSMDQGLIANAVVQYTSGEASGSLTFTPSEYESGSTTIVVTLEDSGLDGDISMTADNAVFTRSFTVTVISVNDPPMLDPLSDITVFHDDTESTVKLTNISAGRNESQAIRITASSSNQSVIPTPAISYAPNAETADLTFMTTGVLRGETTLTVTIEDAGNDNDFATVEDNAIYTESLQVKVTGAKFAVENDVLQLTISDPLEIITLIELTDGIAIDLSGGVWQGQDSQEVTGVGLHRVSITRAHDFQRIEVLGLNLDKIVYQNSGSWIPGASLETAGKVFRSIVNSGNAPTLFLEWPNLWNNPILATDIDGNGVVQARDSLLLVNEIARNWHFSYRVPLAAKNPLTSPFFLDPNGDGSLTTVDVLLVLNRLFAQTVELGAESEATDLVMSEWNVVSDSVKQDRTNLVPSSATSGIASKTRWNGSKDPVGHREQAYPSGARSAGRAQDSSQNGLVDVAQQEITLLKNACEKLLVYENFHH